MNPNDIEVLRAAARILGANGLPATAQRLIDIVDELDSEGV